MAKLVWDKTGERFYKTGVDHAVLYVQANDGTYPKGVAWNGISNITESPSGGEQNAVYADNLKYLNLTSAEEFGASIECYTYPDEFEECNGAASVATGVHIGQQTRKSFGFVYRSILGNDIQGNDYGYELHLIYSCKASPSEESHDTVNDSPEAASMSFELETTSVALTSKDTDGNTYKPTSVIKIDSTKADPTKLAALEEILFGKDESSAGAGDGVDAKLPSPDEVITMMAASSSGS